MVGRTCRVVANCSHLPDLPRPRSSLQYRHPSAMGEIWAKPSSSESQLKEQLKETQAEEPVALVPTEQFQAEVLARRRRVRRAWQARDEAARIGGLLRDSWNRAASASVPSRASARWNKVGKDWKRVGGGDDDDDFDRHNDKEVKQRPSASTPDASSPSPRALEDPRSVWEECARRGQEWASRRDKAEDGESLIGQSPGDDIRLSRMASAPVSPASSPKSYSFSRDQQQQRFSFGSLQAALGEKGFSWISSRAGGWSTLSSGGGSSRRRFSAANDGEEREKEETEEDAAAPGSAWSEIQDGMSTMLRRLDNGGGEQQQWHPGGGHRKGSAEPLILTQAQQQAGSGHPIRGFSGGEGVAVQPAGGQAHQEAGAEPLQRGVQPLREQVTQADLQQGRVRQAAAGFRVGVPGHQGQDLHEQGHPGAVRNPQPGGRAANSGWNTSQSDVLQGSFPAVHCDQRQGSGAVVTRT